MLKKDDKIEQTILSPSMIGQDPAAFYKYYENRTDN